MKNLITLLVVLLSAFPVAHSQNNSNTNPDAIVGVYRIVHKGDVSKIRIYKCSDGSYEAQCIYLQDSIDKKTGKLRLDTKNPNKNLRNVPSNKVILITGMRYNAKKQRWDGGRIYDPLRGIHARCTCSFTDNNQLKLRGSVLGIGETIYWQPIR